MMFLRSLLIASVADAQKCIVSDPANTPHATANCAAGTGISGDVVDDGSACVAQCASDSPMPAKLTCDSGSIGKFDCVDPALKCVVPVPKGPAKAQAATPCTSGTNVRNAADKCTLQCASGYEIVEADYSVADALECKIISSLAGNYVKGSGSYTDAATTTDGTTGVQTGNYTCGPSGCTLAVGAHPASGGLVDTVNVVCTYNDGTNTVNKVEGDKIPHGAECVSVCATGNEATLKSRKCNMGTWAPTFAQVDKHKCPTIVANGCIVPTLAKTGSSSNDGLSCTEAAQAAASGQNLVANGNNCTANCPAGFTANSDLKTASAALACNNNIADFNFVCNPMSCDGANSNITIAGGGSTATQFCKVDGTATDTVPSGKRCMPNCTSGETGYVPLPGSNDGILCLEGEFRKADGAIWAAVTTGSDVFTSGPTIECVADASCRVPDPPAYYNLQDDSASKKVTQNCSNVAAADLNTTGNQITGTVAASTFEANVCIAQCVTGYEPSVTKLTCNTVTSASPILAPMNFVCTPKNCVVPAPRDNVPANRIYAQVGSIKTNYLQHNDEAELMCDSSGSPADLYDATASNGITAFSSSNKIKCVLGQLKHGSSYADDFLGWTCIADATNDCLLKRVAANAQYYADTACAAKDVVANSATCDWQCAALGMPASGVPLAQLVCTSGALADAGSNALTNNIFTCEELSCTLPAAGAGASSVGLCKILNGSRTGTVLAESVALKGGEVCEAICTFATDHASLALYSCGKAADGSAELKPVTTSHTCANTNNTNMCALVPPLPENGGPADGNPCTTGVTSPTEQLLAPTEACTLVCASGFTAARVQTAAPTDFDDAPDTPSANPLIITCASTGRFTYTCTAAQCTLSATEVPDANAASGGNFCQSGNTIDHGSDCVTQCAANHRPNVAKLSCSQGVFSPIGFWCIANPTAAANVGGGCEILPLSPTATVTLDGGSNYQVSCAGNAAGGEESVLLSGATGAAVCVTPSCASSHTAKYWNGTAATDPTDSTHVCTDGALSAARFSCLATNACLAGGIQDAKEVMCMSEGVLTNAVATTKECLVQCQDGFYPNVDRILCTNGVWSQATGDNSVAPYDGNNPTDYFPPGSLIQGLGDVACLARDCMIADPVAWPSHDGKNCASSSDVGGANVVNTVTSKVGHMKQCVPQCLVGYEPEQTVLKCDRGILTPPSFTCREMGCSISQPSQGGHTGGPCSNVSADGLMAYGNDVQKLRSGEKCILQCDSSATMEANNNTEITCKKGALKPVSTFTCQTTDCKIVPAGSNAMGSTVCKNEQAYGTNQAIIQHGGDCTPGCNAGYKAMPERLLCAEPGVVVDNYLGTVLANNLAQYSCTEMGCTVEAPLSGNGTDAGHCKKIYDSADSLIAGKTGSKLAHGEKCEMQCAETYVAKPVKLKCSLGKLIDGASGGDPFMGRFECVGANACFVANPATGAKADGVNCTNAEVKNVFTTGTCDAGCSAGYVPNGAASGVTTLPVTCNSGTPQTGGTDLTSNSYTCDEKTCDLGSVTNGSDPLCSETRTIGAGSADSPSALTGSVLPSGKQCTTACAAGHTSTSTTIKCEKGMLTPSKFECAPDTGCIVPSPVADGFDYGNCTGSTTNALAASGTCTPRCKDDSYTASETTLTCNSANSLSPATFTCSPKKCTGTPPTTNGASNFCSNIGNGSPGNDVLPGDWCTTTCADGFEPSVSILICQGGATPAFVNTDGSAVTAPGYTCGAKTCRVPVANYATNVAITEPPCSSVMSDGTGGDGFIVASGSKCTTQCEDGYVPKVDQAELTCTNGVLKDSATTPADISASNMFTCVAQKCTIPNPAANANSTGNCSTGGTTTSGVTTTDSGATCATQCNTGFTADNGSDDTTVADRVNLTCTLGELSNSGKFVCKANAADCAIIYTGTGAADKACSENSGTNMRADTETCTLQCAEGYTPNQVSRKCVSGLFKQTDGVTAPAAFSCTEKTCTVPAPKSGNGNATSLCTGVTKTSDATIVASGAECQAACGTGYTASVASLSCTRGALTPENFECKPANGCIIAAPTEGSALDTGFYCGKIKNSDGTDAATADSNVLADGQTCEPKCAPHASDSEMNKFPHNGADQLASIACAAGNLTPSSWSCKVIPDLSVADLATKLEEMLVAHGIVLRAFADSTEIGTKLSEWKNAAAADVAAKRDAFVNSLTGPTDAQKTALKKTLADNVTSALGAIEKIRADRASTSAEVKTEFHTFITDAGITPAVIVGNAAIIAAWTAYADDANATATDFIDAFPDLTEAQVTAITAFIAKYPKAVLVAGINAWLTENEVTTSTTTTNDNTTTTTTTTSTSTTTTSSSTKGTESGTNSLGVSSAFVLASVAAAFRG